MTELNKLERIPKLERFIVDYNKWQRSGVGTLLDGQGDRCCLGFYAGAKGFTDDELLNAGLPSCLASNDSKAAFRIGEFLLVSREGEFGNPWNGEMPDDEDEDLCIDDISIIQEIANINDASLSDNSFGIHTEEDRMKLLIAKFKELGIEVLFEARSDMPGLETFVFRFCDNQKMFGLSEGAGWGWYYQDTRIPEGMEHAVRGPWGTYKDAVYDAQMFVGPPVMMGEPLPSGEKALELGRRIHKQLEENVGDPNKLIITDEEQESNK